MMSLEQLRARFARDEGLPFADVLTEAGILDALNEHGVKYRDRVFSPVTTIWGFLSQVLNDDHSCRDAVTRIIAHRAANGLETCSPNTASYCTARGRLLTGVLSTLAKGTAKELQAGVPRGWKWNGRSVFIADGSHVWMPDTPENRAVYPQPVVQQPGIGFPLARVAVLLSLATNGTSLSVKSKLICICGLFAGTFKTTYRYSDYFRLVKTLQFQPHRLSQLLTCYRISGARA
jgi:hypothetical protein